jgi:hypothetical protein
MQAQTGAASRTHRDADPSAALLRAAGNEFTDDFAQLQPPPPELQQLIGAIHGNQTAMDAFVSVQAATLPAPEFFAPESIGAMMG